jgi:hypothetical protein
MSAAQRSSFASVAAHRVRPGLALGGLVLWIVLAASPAAAVIIATGDGTANTTAPADDFGFDNVGSIAETAVYLGNGWVISANHVSQGDVRLVGRDWPSVPGSKLRLRSPDARVSADLALFRLREPLPPLASLHVSQTGPGVGEHVVLMGNGPDRGEPVVSEGKRGWSWADSHSLRWGTNQVHATGLTVQAGIGDSTVAFSMRLSPTHPTPFESTVGIGDSGGAAFVKRDGRWELAGVLFAAKTWSDQPARTALYGNITYAADLSVYREQIESIVKRPACSDGLDDDGDGRVDFPQDEGCTSAQDETEGDAHAPPAAAAAPARQADGPEGDAPRSGGPPATSAKPCGRGFDVAWVVPVLLAARRRRPS